jgi:branched-chain amino acid transport system ATP-binding protein
MTGETMLSAEALVGGYGAVEVLHGVGLSVARNGITALVGGNGAGKTTTLRMLSGLIGATAGEIRFEGEAITSWDAARRVAAGIALVPEGRLIFPDMSVEENLRLGAFSARARRHTAESLERMYALFPRLAERRRQAGSTLSGGEQQMLALGRGLMSLPTVLLLDEPTLGLSPQMVDLIFGSVLGLRAEGMTILLSEQNVARTLEAADHAYVIENGRIAMEGGGKDLLGDDAVRKAYLGL